jgi:3-hydroxyisobutyrate dehydrogenase
MCGQRTWDCSPDAGHQVLTEELGADFAGEGERVNDTDAIAVAFIGVGSMGWPMAANLVKAGFPVSVVDAAGERANRFVDEVGGTAPADAATAIADAPVVVTMLPTSEHVADVVRGNIEAFGRGCLLIDMTSGVPNVSCDLAVELERRGVRFVDCPVSGGVRRAEVGELAIMAGGAEADVDRARPLLDVMGSSVQHCGGVGAGQAMKALNNLVSAGGFLIAAEALAIGRAYGLDPEHMVDVLNSSSGMNNSTQVKFKQYVLSRSFDAGFGLDLMVKDLGIAVDVARDQRVVSPFAALCFQLWAAAAVQLGPGQDHTEMARFVEEVSGVMLSETAEPGPQDA